MALVPAANGVDAIIGGYGIQALDEGNNRFSVALNVTLPTRNLGPLLLPDVIPGARSQILLNPAGPIQSPVTGLHIIEALLVADANGEEGIVIEPDDRVSFVVVELDNGEEVIANETTIPVTPRAAGDPEPYQSCIAVAVYLAAGTQYNYYLRLLNASGTLTLGDSTIGGGIYPLTANQQPPAPPGALMRAARRMPRVLFRRH